mmetsp:Transcript_17277/g.45041  ORF Transcript_17277/g.45041 Transcript_17277/m.45041 type:complete len:377 (-) Transcript_17277:59-1189(-)
MPRRDYGAYSGPSPRIALVLTPLNDDNLMLAAQVGATDVVYYNMDSMPDSAVELKATRARVESYGLRLSCVEGGPPMDKIILGTDGRDEQIENFKRCIRAMGEAGIPILCYNFMSKGFVVGRNSYEAPARGGSLTSEWRAADYPAIEIPTKDGLTTAEQLWASLEFFLDAVIPTAEECGVYLAMHPDDPPMPLVKGSARIMTSPEAFERLIALNPSPHNGITFCQGCFSEMGVDVPDAIGRLGHRAHFVHFRDVKGTAEDFIETWQDEGQTDMHKTLEAWKACEFNGIIRPDHVCLLPQMEEGHATEEKAAGYFSGTASGYTMVGRIWAVGYMRGLFDAVFGRATSSVVATALDPDKLSTTPRPLAEGAAAAQAPK